MVMIPTTEKIRGLQRCAEAGVKAGCPKDQVTSFMERGYIPLPWQWAFHAAAREADFDNGPVDIGLGGARGPGKSHAVLSQVALDDCQRVAHLKVLFLRQTGNAAKESFEDLVGKVVNGHVEYKATAKGIRFTNGSRVTFGGFRTERDIDKFIGIEYDVIIVEELNQLSEGKYNKLRGSLRTSKPNWRPRMYTSFNPGGLGHSFVKARYVIPHREKTETSTKFVPSTYRQNPHTHQEYRNYLESLDGDLGKAWREGEWDLFAGQFFGEWRHARHVVKPFAIPASWLRFRSIDPSGRDGITSCHWYALDQDGRVWAYREHYGTGMDADEHAKEIARLSLDDYGMTEDYKYTIIDTAAFAKAGYSETTAEIYERCGVTGLMPAAKDRIPGWNLVHTYLRWEERSWNEGTKQEDTKQVKPMLQIFENCINLIRTLPEQQFDEKHPEDLDTKGEDHALDELRYILRTFRDNHAQPVLSEVKRRMKRISEASDDFDYVYHR